MERTCPVRVPRHAAHRRNGSGRNLTAWRNREASVQARLRHAAKQTGGGARSLSCALLRSPALSCALLRSPASACALLRSPALSCAPPVAKRGGEEARLHTAAKAGRRRGALGLRMCSAAPFTHSPGSSARPALRGPP